MLNDIGCMADTWFPLTGSIINCVAWCWQRRERGMFTQADDHQGANNCALLCQCCSDTRLVLHHQSLLLSQCGVFSRWAPWSDTWTHQFPCNWLKLLCLPFFEVGAALGCSHAYVLVMLALAGRCIGNLKQPVCVGWINLCEYFWILIAEESKEWPLETFWTTLAFSFWAILNRKTN